MTNPKATRGAGPLFIRLTRAGRLEDVAFLAKQVIARNAVANDNVPPADDMGTDSIMVMRPTVEEITRASVKIRDGKPDEDGEIGLRFAANGRLLEWRVSDENGVPRLNRNGEEIWLKPDERYKQSKGERRKTSNDLSVDEAKHAEHILALRGVGTMPIAWIPDTRYPTFDAIFDRLKLVYDAMLRVGIVSKNRLVLMAHGVDGGRTLEQAAEANPQATVTRGRTVVARGAEFLAGKTDSGGTATEGSFVGAPDAAELTMISAIDANAAAANIGDVLDMALSGMTAMEIAESKGWQGKQGERRAVLEIDAEIAQLRRAA